MNHEFVKLKQYMVTSLLLALPDFEKSFIVESDASDSSVGTVLAQKKENGRIHPVK